MAKPRTIIGYLLPTLPMLLALALYGFSLRLPFFWDDVPHFITSETINGLNQWGDFPSFPYYRPVVFSIWKLFEGVIGRNDPLVLHWLNVVVFAISSLILTQLVRYIVPHTMKSYSGLFAGIAFVLFPFSYRAIPLVGALFHLLLVLGFLMSFYLALLWIDRKIGRWGLFGCWLSAFLAVFSHENGVLLLPLFLGLLGIKYFKVKPNIPRILQIVIPYIMISSAYFFLWFIAFRPQGGGESLTEAFDVALAVLLQGLIYPFASILRPFIDGDVAPEFLIALVIAVVSPAFFIVWSLSKDNRVHLLLVCLYGLGWYVLSVLPAGLFLSAGYVLGSPRLTMLASVGSSIFWAVVISTLIHQTRFPRLSTAYKVCAIGLIGLFTYVSVEFLIMRRADFLQMGTYQWELQDILAEQVTDPNNIVLVNMPDYITPLENNRRFLLGTEGVLFVNPSENYGEQLNVNANNDTDYSSVTVLSYPDIVHNDAIDFSAHPSAVDRNGAIEHIRNASDLIVTQFHAGEFYPLYVKGNLSDTDSVVDFGNGQVYLTQGQVILNNRSGTIDVITQWGVNVPLGIKMFVHVYCEDVFIGQSDGYPLGDTYPFTFWNSGESQVDIRRIYLTRDVDEDCLRVYAGLYYESDVTRLEAIRISDETVYPDNLVPLEITSQ